MTTMNNKAEKINNPKKTGALASGPDTVAGKFNKAKMAVNFTVVLAKRDILADDNDATGFTIGSAKIMVKEEQQVNQAKIGTVLQSKAKRAA